MAGAGGRQAAVQSSDTRAGGEQASSGGTGKLHQNSWMLGPVGNHRPSLEGPQIKVEIKPGAGQGLQEEGCGSNQGNRVVGSRADQSSQQQWDHLPGLQAKELDSKRRNVTCTQYRSWACIFLWKYGLYTVLGPTA